MADRAGQAGFWQEVHRHAQDPSALAAFTTSAGEVEGKVAGAQAQTICLGLLGKEPAQGRVDFAVGGHVGARDAPNRLMRDGDQLAQVLPAGDPVVFACSFTRAIKMLAASALQDVKEQG